MRKITAICQARVLGSQIKDIQHSMTDAIDMALERVGSIIAEVRLKDASIEWRAACDEILDRIAEE